MKKGDGGDNMEQLRGCFSAENQVLEGSETVRQAREGSPYLNWSGMHLLLNRPLEPPAENPFPFNQPEQHPPFSC